MIIQNQSIMLNIKDAEDAFHKQIDNFAIHESQQEYSLSPNHHHTFLEMVYVVSGTIDHSINGEELKPLHAGDYIFIDIGTTHSLVVHNALGITMVFTPQLIDKNIQSCSSLKELFKNDKFSSEMRSGAFPVDTILHDNDGSLLNIIRFLKSKFENPQRLSGKIIRNSVISMLMHILEPQFQDNKKINPITEALIKIVDEHYQEQNLLSCSAAELNYTIPYISAVFKNDFGVSFKEYLQIHRINKAKYLLDTTNMAISDICYAVGYSNIKFFRSIFRKYTNMTPTQYKKSPSFDHIKKTI
ncbi:MAG: helix-turn-helix domain-containing protein [Ruminococcaceae bacterium]|nr:helix-turn-helix domain-containing protein [Oscillospiraceae bacterium]